MPTYLCCQLRVIAHELLVLWLLLFFFFFFFLFIIIVISWDICSRWNVSETGLGVLWSRRLERGSFRWRTGAAELFARRQTSSRPSRTTEGPSRTTKGPSRTTARPATESCMPSIECCDASLQRRCCSRRSPLSASDQHIEPIHAPG